MTNPYSSCCSMHMPQPMPTRTINLDGTLKGASYMKGAIHRFTERSTQLANEILGSTPSSDSYRSERTVIIRNYYSSPWWTPWPMYQPIYVIDGGSGRRDNSDMNCLIGLIAVIVGGIALFATGTALSRYQDSDSELADNERFQGELDRFSFGLRDASETKLYEQVEHAKHAATLKARICHRIRNSALTDLVLRISTFVGCALALTGIFATLPGLVSVGTIVGLVSGGAMLFKWGFESTSRRLEHDAHELKHSVNLLK